MLQNLSYQRGWQRCSTARGSIGLQTKCSTACNCQFGLIGLPFHIFRQQRWCSTSTDATHAVVKGLTRRCSSLWHTLCMATLPAQQISWRAVGTAGETNNEQLGLCVRAYKQKVRILHVAVGGSLYQGQKESCGSGRGVRSPIHTS